jgi:hypothetical protein
VQDYKSPNDTLEDYVPKYSKYDDIPRESDPDKNYLGDSYKRDDEEP